MDRILKDDTVMVTAKRHYLVTSSPRGLGSPLRNVPAGLRGYFLQVFSRYGFKC